MGLMDLFNQGDMREKLYAAASKNNVPQGGVTGAMFGAMFPQGLGNMLFGRNPEPVPDLASPQGTQYMADLASNMMVPGTFIGPKGMSNLMGDDVARGLMSSAEAKLAQGVPKEEVFRELGVFRGPEGKWRYEIDDSGMTVTPDAIQKAEQGGAPFARKWPLIGESVQHDELFGTLDSAYTSRTDGLPYNMEDIRLVKNQIYTDATDGMDGGYWYGGPGREEIIVGADALGDSQRLKSTVTHELQHAIQERENFARGGDPSMFIDSATPFDDYLNLAGEAEAREVQKRINMGTPERRSIFPDYANKVNWGIRGLMGD